jgi:hypothetical protein
VWSAWSACWPRQADSTLVRPRAECFWQSETDPLWPTGVDPPPYPLVQCSLLEAEVKAGSVGRRRCASSRCLVVSPGGTRERPRRPEASGGLDGGSPPSVLAAMRESTRPRQWPLSPSPGSLRDRRGCSRSTGPGQRRAPGRGAARRAPSFAEVVAFAAGAARAAAGGDGDGLLVQVGLRRLQDAFALERLEVELAGGVRCPRDRKASRAAPKSSRRCRGRFYHEALAPRPGHLERGVVKSPCS